MERYFASVETLCKSDAIEGFFAQEQSMQLDKFLKDIPEIKKIGEIGFNVGMSSATCLNARSDIEVMSFDLCAHKYIGPQKHIIDEIFPGRHALLIGDSRNSLPILKKYHQEPFFDMVIVDGGHEGDVPYLDIQNSLSLLKSGGWIYIDDVCEYPWAVDVVKATSLAIEKGAIIETKFYQSTTRGWVIGKKP
jgi:predicted O-methyltransferase YrrM